MVQAQKQSHGIWQLEKCSFCFWSKITQMDKEMNQQELAEELEEHCELKGNSCQDWLGMIMEL